MTHKIFVDDDGPIPFPDLETRFQLIREYGQWFVGNDLTPGKIVNLSNMTDEPLNCFLRYTQRAPGFNKDMLIKKNLLLAMCMANRPEKFLDAKDAHNWRSVVDYHLMRVSLRLGLVDLIGESPELDFEQNLQEKIIQREWVGQKEENDIRRETYLALKQLTQESGCSHSFLDETLWMARKYCPEMEESECSKCIFDEVCMKRIELFQPVFRTTAY